VVSHMDRERTLVAKTQLAELALIWHFSSMNIRMLIQVLFAGEKSIAHVTSKPILVQMLQKKVSFQINSSCV
jgi:hypothetical protein